MLQVKMNFKLKYSSLFLYYIKQIDSMLLCVCLVVDLDHQRSQNVVRTSVTYLVISSCATFLLLSHFDVICDLLLNTRMARWSLFVNQTVCWTLEHVHAEILQVHATCNVYVHVCTCTLIKQARLFFTKFKNTEKRSTGNVLKSRENKEVHVHEIIENLWKLFPNRE